MSLPPLKSKAARAACLALFAGTAWVLLEWSFFATKPSFMSLYTGLEKYTVLPGTALVVVAALLALLLPCLAAGWLLQRVGAPRWLVFSAMVLPALLTLTTALLVAVDNFTLTVAGWGIRNASGAAIWAYRLFNLALLVVCTRWLLGQWRDEPRSQALSRMTLVCALLLVTGLPGMLLGAPVNSRHFDDLQEHTGHMPNILILSGDGISASNMSLYGYARATTPFLESIRDELLIADNHFSNARDTGGSVISLLTGKLPTTTRVIYPPDVLRGEDSYQHLPGLLASLGYYTADISMRHYADPFDLNLRNGFVEANFRKLDQSGGALVSALRQVPSLSSFSLLLDRMTERAAERLRHVWKDEPMQDPYATVNIPDRQWLRDERRMQEIQRIIDTAPRPFFLHVHMLGTHGKKFRPRERKWSTEDDYPNLWSIDGYDDAIADFDRYVGETYAALAAAGILESTVLLVNSDHGLKHAVLDRLPLALRLPGKSRVGRLEGNTQRLDIAPTLVDLLGIEPQPWMEGDSLLSLDPERANTRVQFATGSTLDKSADGIFFSAANPVAPWYSMGHLFMIRCDQGFELKLKAMRLRGRTIPGTNAQCAGRLSDEEARQLMLEHLERQGYSWN